MQVINNNVWAEFHEIRNAMYFEFLVNKSGMTRMNVNSILMLECALLYLIKKNALSLVVDNTNHDKDVAFSFLPTNNNNQRINAIVTFPDTQAGERSKLILKSFNEDLDTDSHLLEYITFCFNTFTSDNYFEELPDHIFASKFDETSILQPKEVTTIVSHLIHKNEPFSIYNPFGGYASFGASMPKSCDYYGQDNNDFAVSVSQFRLALCGFDRAFFCNSDSIRNWPNEKYDLILSSPPFHMSMDGVEDEYNPMHYTDIENWILDKSLASLKENGQIVMLFSASFLYDNKHDSIRRLLIESNLLDSIIMLPPNIWSNTSIRTAIVSIRKDRKKDDKIMMFNAQEYYSWTRVPRSRLKIDDILDAINGTHCKDIVYVTPEQVSESGYILTPAQYLFSIKVPKGHQLVRVRDIAKVRPIIRDTIAKKGKLYQSPSYGAEPYFISASASVRTFVRELRVAVLSEPTLLICPHSSSFSAVFVVASKNDPILIDRDDLFKCELDNRLIDRDYFIRVMGHIDPMANRQLFGVSEGVFEINTIPLLRICILPSIYDQKKVVEEARYNAKLASIKNASLESLLKQKEDELKQMKSDVMDEIRNRKHDMKTPMAQLRNTLLLLDNLALQLPEEYSAQLKKYAKRQRVALDTLSEIVQHIADEDIFANPEPIDIEDILSRQVTKNDSYVIEYLRDDAALKEAGIDKPKVYIGRVDFIRLVQNIVSNAIKHGFKRRDVEYTLQIILTVEDDFFVISFTNNGEPLPKEMDTARFGMKNVKSVDSDGTGNGGYIVKTISQHYGGDYEISSYQSTGVNYTRVIVKLPIFRS